MMSEYGGRDGIPLTCSKSQLLFDKYEEVLLSELRLAVLLECFVSLNLRASRRNALVSSDMLDDVVSTEYLTPLMSTEE
jgi:hypothetical protein